MRKEEAMENESTPDVICGQCGEKMVMREVTPCLDCGGLQGEMAEFKNKKRSYFKVGLLANEIVCDFCLADIAHYDPPYYGFPDGFSWSQALKDSVLLEVKDPDSKTELACSNSRCENTFRRQEFIKKNAKKNKVILPPAFWPNI